MDLLVATNGYIACLAIASCHSVPAMVVGTNGLPARVTVEECSPRAISGNFRFSLKPDLAILGNFHIIKRLHIFQ